MNSRQMTVSVHKWGNCLAARFFLIVLAFVVSSAGTALAQNASNKRSSKSNTTTEAADPPASSSADQLNSGEQAPVPAGVTIGNYNVHGSLNMGWRYNNMTGSEANYDTFVNLHQGPRLLDFSFNAHSLNHDGAFFDNLSLAGFGFGGDPVDVVRLNVTKDKWYNFDATYRRYKYFWDYNLLANPLNPSNSTPEIAVTASTHLMDLSHRMTDLQLKLFPQSPIHVRLGYTHSLEVGPAFTTDGAAVNPINEIGIAALLFQNFKTTEDNYDAGIDFALLPRTTLSYDEYIQHYKEDTYASDGNLIFQLPDGTPVDLGLVFSPGTPCTTPITNSTTTPPTANPSCQGAVSYERGLRPRSTILTERFGFQTTYLRNLNMTGQFSYSSGQQTVDNNNLFNTWFGVNSRIASLGTSDLAGTRAKRIIVNGNWNGVYDVTAKFRIMDSFNYNNYRIPGIYNLNDANFYAPLGSLTLTEAEAAAQNPAQFLFNSANCPFPFTAATCPQHSSSSNPDSALGYEATYLSQDFRSNTFELAYDFTPHVGAHLGYRYTKRIITDLSDGQGDFERIFYTAETFDPGGPTGAVEAFRGDCARSGTLAPGSSFPVYFTGTTNQRGTCTVQSDYSVVFNGIGNAKAPANYVQEANIDGNSALFGLWVRPASNFRTSFDLELFSADESFMRITPRLLRHYQINSTYAPVKWADITGTIDITDSSDNVTQVQNKDHNRSYGLSATFTAGSRFSFDLFYNYSDIYNQALVCYTLVSGGPQPAGTPACPIPGSPVTAGAITTYSSKTNFASADIMVKPVKPVTFTLGYAGSFVRGTPSWFNPLSSYSVPFLDPLTPYGPLRFNYQTPYVTMNWNVYRGLSYIASWNYYGYNSRGNNNPAGLAPLGTQDFNGNSMTMSAQYSF